MVVMEEIPRDVLEARLTFDEALDALLRAGDYKTVLRVVEQVRRDLTVFARHARRLAAACDDPERPVKPPAPLDEAAQQVLSQMSATMMAVRERDARREDAGENVAFLIDHRNRRRKGASGWA